MSCPRCSAELTEQKASDGNRLLCADCGGFWIDPEPLANTLRKRGIVMPEDGGTAGEMLCPRDGATLATFSFGGVELDRCGQCGGLWLDRGEWEKVSAACGGRANVGMIAAGAVGVAAVGGAAVAASAMQQPENQETASRTADVAAEVAGGFFECLCELAGCIDF